MTRSIDDPVVGETTSMIRGRPWHVFARCETLPLFVVVMVAVARSSAAYGQEAVPTPANSRAAPATFTIAAFDVSGATKLDSDTIEEAVYNHAGPDRTTADVEAARAALQAAYAKRGLETVQVDVPPQPDAQFAQGIVLLRVTEAPLGKVTVSGQRFHSAERVRQQIPALVVGQPLDVKALQTQVTDANRFPDRTVTPSFAAGTVPGTVDVDLAVEDSLPVHGSISLDNDHSPSTTPLRLNAGVRYSNLWGLGHTASLTYIVAPQNRSETEVFSGSYTAPLLGSPWTIVLYGYKSNSNVASLGGVNVLGNGYQIGTRAIYRLPPQKYSANVTLGLDYKNFQQNISLSNQLAAKQPIQYLPFYASAGLSSGSDKYSLDVTLSSTLGLRFLRKVGCFSVDATQTCVPTDQFRNKDFESNENFVHVNLSVEYKRVLPHDFIGTAKFYGQVADSHLVTNEQFATGGLSTVRGYLQSEGVGDDGFAQSIELGTPSAASYLGPSIDELRGFAFAEFGYVRTLSVATPDQRDHEGFVSVGGGARLKLLKHILGEISVGVPLTNGPTSRAGDARATFSAKGEF